jgi:LPS sulfotransferase NodH
VTWGMQMIRFVILTTQRTGATFFMDCLSNHPQIQTQKAGFGQKRWLIFSLDKRKTGYYLYRSRSIRQQFDHLFRRKRLIYEYMATHYQPIGGVKALGLKVSYNYVEKYPQLLEWLREQDDLRVIHFIRWNSLKTIISRETAQKRGLYHATEKVEPIKIHLQPKKLKRELALISRQVEKYRYALRGKPYIEVFYELFTTHRDNETQRVLQFLGIDQFVPLRTDLVKINPDAIEDMVENYEQVVQVLENSVYEVFLDDKVDSTTGLADSSV